MNIAVPWFRNSSPFALILSMYKEVIYQKQKGVNYLYKECNCKTEAIKVFHQSVVAPIEAVNTSPMGCIFVCV